MDKDIELIELSDDESKSTKSQKKRIKNKEKSNNLLNDLSKDLPKDLPKDLADVEIKKNFYDIVLIQKDKIEVDEPRIMEFIRFCLNKKLFDDSFYDYGNAFSVIATKLPVLFEKLSTNGNTITKTNFRKVFKNYKFRGDINFIYEKMNVGGQKYVTWEQFLDFFLPFVRYVTI